MTLGTAMCCGGCITEHKQAVPHSVYVCIWDDNIKMNLKETSFEFSLNTSAVTQG